MKDVPAAENPGGVATVGWDEDLADRAAEIILACPQKMEGRDDNTPVQEKELDARFKTKRYTVHSYVVTNLQSSLHWEVVY